MVKLGLSHLFLPAVVVCQGLQASGCGSFWFYRQGCQGFVLFGLEICGENQSPWCFLEYRVPKIHRIRTNNLQTINQLSRPSIHEVMMSSSGSSDVGCSFLNANFWRKSTWIFWWDLRSLTVLGHLHKRNHQWWAEGSKVRSNRVEMQKVRWRCVHLPPSLLYFRHVWKQNHFSLWTI